MGRPTIVVKHQGTLHKAFKLWFGRDGSYYVTVPYHQARSATLFKIVASYDAGIFQHVPLEQIVDVGILDDENRVKLSHHPSGLCQFSGTGVLSGRDEQGEIRGIGIQSARLSDIGSGPAFGVVMQGMHDFETIQQPHTGDVVLDGDRLLPWTPDEPTGYTIEGHYFQPQYRRFVKRDSDNRLSMQIVHPSGAILTLPVLLADEGCEYPGFFGIDIFRSTPDFGGSGFSLNGPGDTVRLNDKGEKVATLLTCAYPRLPFNLPGERNVNFPPRPS